MAKHTALFCVVATVVFAPGIFSAPVLGREECVCQPIDFSSSDNSSLASCQSVAEDIRQWRALAFHSPLLADIFVDAEERLRLPSRGHSEKRRFAHELRTIKTPTASFKTTFDSAVKDIFRRIKKNPNSKGSIRPREGQSISELPKYERILGPIRPSWPWEQSNAGDRSPGRIVEAQAPAPKFLAPSHRYRIMCRSKDISRGAIILAESPELMFVLSVVIVALWLWVCDMLLAMFRSFLSPTREDDEEEGAILLGGTEKNIFAYTIDLETLEAYQLTSEDIDAVTVPAASSR